MSAILGRTCRAVAAAAALSIPVFAAGAQLPNASPAAYGMAGNYTAIARGYEAVAWNPANLGLWGRPFISFGTGIAGGTFGFEPVDITMFHAYAGDTVPFATRQSWLALVTQSGRQRIRADAGGTPFAMSVGPVGLQVGVASFANADLSPDAFEAFMFGNAGNNGGIAKAIDLTGTRVASGVISTAAASFALPVPFKFSGGLVSGEQVAIAVTGKYVIGNGVLVAADTGGSNLGTGTPMTVNLPMITPDSGYDALAGLGVGTGADVSLAWSGGKFRVGILAENVFNTFKWDTTKLRLTTQAGMFDIDTVQTSTTYAPFSAAPQSLRDEITQQVFKPAITIGAAFQVSSRLVLTADLHKQTGGDEAISFGPRSRMGVGAELRILPFVPLRAGVASVTDGWQAAGGFGIRFLGYELGVSGSVRRRGAANESGLMFGVVGIGH